MGLYQSLRPEPAKSVTFLTGVSSEHSLEESPDAQAKTKTIDLLILASLDEVLIDLVGPQVRKALYDNWFRFHSLAREDIPLHLNKFINVLEVTFGTASRTIEKAVLRRVFSEFNWKFEEVSAFEFPDYIEQLRARTGRSKERFR